MAVNLSPKQQDIVIALKQELFFSPKCFLMHVARRFMAGWIPTAIARGRTDGAAVDSPVHRYGRCVSPTEQRGVCGHLITLGQTPYSLITEHRCQYHGIGFFFNSLMFSRVP